MNVLKKPFYSIKKKMKTKKENLLQKTQIFNKKEEK